MKYWPEIRHTILFMPGLEPQTINQHLYAIIRQSHTRLTNGVRRIRTTAFMITDTTYTTRETAAWCSPVQPRSYSMIKNRSLLSNVSNFTPFCIAGFNGEIGKSHRGSKSVENLENMPSTKRKIDEIRNCRFRTLTYL